MTPLHHCIIDALTISEGRFKKPCPVLVLKMMLLNGEKSRFSEEIKNQALLLLATYRKLLRAVARDLCDVKTLKDSVKRRHFNKLHMQYGTITFITSATGVLNKLHMQYGTVIRLYELLIQFNKLNMQYGTA